jgi:hypothetical protein
MRELLVPRYAYRPLLIFYSFRLPIREEFGSPFQHLSPTHTLCVVAAEPLKPDGSLVGADPTYPHPRLPHIPAAAPLPAIGIAHAQECRLRASKIATSRSHHPGATGLPLVLRAQPHTSGIQPAGLSLARVYSLLLGSLSSPSLFLFSPPGAFTLSVHHHACTAMYVFRTKARIGLENSLKKKTSSCSRGIDHRRGCILCVRHGLSTRRAHRLCGAASIHSLWA